MIGSTHQNIYTGYAEKREVRPKIAVLDRFLGADQGVTHGEMTESVVLTTGGLTDSDVQRMENSLSNSVDQIFASQGESESVRDFIRNGAVRFLNANTANLKLLADEQPDLKIVSQSQSQSPGRMAQTVAELERDFPGLQELVGKGLGLEPGANQAEVLQAVILKSEEIFRDDKEVKQARSEYEEQARKASERGVVQLVAAGNLGHFAQSLAQAGVKAAPDTYRSLLVNEYTTVVGALTDEGQPADFNSPNAGIEVYADGVGVAWSVGDKSGVADGTSFATPQVAAAALKLAEAHPDWSPFQIEGALAGFEAHRLGLGEQATLGNGETLVGDGNVDSFVFDILGEGFITGLDDQAVDQFVQAKGKNVRFGLPGNVENQFQIVTARTADDGSRNFTLETYWGENHHVLRARHADGDWIPEQTVEEIHLSLPEPKKAS